MTDNKPRRTRVRSRALAASRQIAAISYDTALNRPAQSIDTGATGTRTWTVN